MHIRIDETNPDIGKGVILKPYQKPHPPIAMSVMKSESLAARTAGQRGYMPLSTNLIPIETIAQHWETYCEGAAEAGQPEPSRDILRVCRNIFVGETNEEAMDYALNSAFSSSFGGLISVSSQPSIKSGLPQSCQRSARHSNDLAIIIFMFIIRLFF